MAGYTPPKSHACSCHLHPSYNPCSCNIIMAKGWASSQVRKDAVLLNLMRVWYQISLVSKAFVAARKPKKKSCIVASVLEGALNCTSSFLLCWCGWEVVLLNASSKWVGEWRCMYHAACSYHAQPQLPHAATAIYNYTTCSLPQLLCTCTKLSTAIASHMILYCSFIVHQETYNNYCHYYSYSDFIPHGLKLGHAGLLHLCN